MRILFVYPDLPAPPTSGGRVRAFHLIREVSRRHEVDVVAPALDDPEGMAATRQIARKLHLFPPRLESPPARRRRHVRSLLVGRLHHPAPDVQAALAQALSAEAYDGLHFVTPYLVPSLQGLGTPVPPVVVDFLGTSVGAWRELRLATGLGPRLRGLARWSAAVRGERWVLGRADTALAISDTDRRYLLRLRPSARIRVVPNGVDADHFAPRAGPEVPSSLAFVGDMSFGPNVDGARHLVRTILPRVRARVPEATVWLVGRQPAPAVLELAADPAVTVTGAVPDVRPFLGRATVAVVPLRGGSGIRNKTLEAMAMGRPVVTTTMGIEGLDVAPGHEVLVADDADGFAGAVADLLGNPDRCRALGAAARRRIVRDYGWEASGSRVEAVYAELAARTKVTGAPGGPRSGSRG